MRTYRRGDNWFLDVSIEGKRTRKKINGARTKTEAQAALAAVKADILRGEFNFKQENRILFEDFAEIYIERHSRPNKRSWKRDITSIKALSPHFAGFPISKIAPFLIEGYKLSRKERVQVSTINRELACLKNMFTKAIDWGFASDNPVRKVKLFSEEDRKRWRILASEELDSLLKNCSRPLKEAVLIALNTGMRVGEILALKWTDVDFQNDYVLIRHSKSGRSRKVPLNSVSRSAFLDLKELSGSHEYVFFNSRTKTHINCIKTAFRAACRRSGIHSLRMHDFRHHAATAMVQAGVDLHTVSKILGHSTIKLTMRYSHPGFDHTRDAVKVLEAIGGRKEENQGKDGTDLAQREVQIRTIH